MMIVMPYACYLREGERPLTVDQPLCLSWEHVHSSVERTFYRTMATIPGPPGLLRERERQMLRHDGLIEEGPGQLSRTTEALNSCTCFRAGPLAMR